MPDFETLLQGSAEEHGHLCAGQVIGVRMALLGLDLIELKNPKQSREIKKLIVYVEIDRCATDAIAYVTGVRLGRRSLKFKDYGIMAATFINLETRRAYRIVSKESARQRVGQYAPHETDKNAQQLVAYRQMPLEVLFDVFEVSIDISDADWPGPTRFKVACDDCGAIVRDGKQVKSNGRTLCHDCSGQVYYRSAVRVTL